MKEMERKRLRRQGRRRRCVRLLMVLIISSSLYACAKKEAELEKELESEKGISEAEMDCKRQMEQLQNIYEKADKGDTSNVVLQDETMLEMQKRAGKTGNLVSAEVAYSNVENYEKLDQFLNNCEIGKSGSVVIYNVRRDGGISRMKFIYDGTEMYVVSTSGIWIEENTPRIAYTTSIPVKEWEYTEKGWFCYELCVPEPPEVTEIMDGSCLIRVKPMTEKQRVLSQLCVQKIGYQGNNLLCSNWNLNNLDVLDYNGLYEYLYAMKYGQRVPPENYPEGIPKEEFENLMMEYLPITSEEIRKYAVFNQEKQTYDWAQLGCMNYTPTFFCTCLPEVIDVKENADGTMVLTVDAVCNKVACDDTVITHELTVRFREDGSFQYLGNEIRKEDRNNVPEYQYRVKGEIKNGS